MTVSVLYAFLGNVLLTKNSILSTKDYEVIFFSLSNRDKVSGLIAK